MPIPSESRLNGKKPVAGAVVGLLLVASAAGLGCGGGSGAPNATPTPQPTPEAILVERLPGSRNHSPDGTWWGFNQSKVVRIGRFVFSYVIDNESSPDSRFTILKKDADGPWQRGASLPTSRPGNVVVDSAGVLHAFVFEPTSSEYFGRLQHYWFPNAASGDVVEHRSEVVVDNDGRRNLETVNIRVGAAVGADGTLAVGFGTLEIGAWGATQQLWIKRPGGSWTQSMLRAQNQLLYPYVVATPRGFGMFSVQDEDNGTGGYVFQFAVFSELDTTGWTSQTLVDHRGHQYASERLTLVQPCDAQVDTAGALHLLYSEFLRPGLPTNASALKHLTRTGSGWDTRSYDLSFQYPGDINCGRFVEVGERPYLIAWSWKRLYLFNLASQRYSEVTLPADATGLWPFVDSPRGGTSPAEAYVDVLLLNADASAYPDGPNYYVRIPKSQFASIP
jgi:hypothetical protein